MAAYSARVNGITHLAITKLDVLDHFERIPLCVEYRVDADRLDTLPADIELLERVEPVYEDVLGWSQQTSEARRLADLPSAARAYIDRIEQIARAKVAYVSVGTRRDQVIQVD